MQLWVKVIGKADLAKLPIIKLKKRYVCANHFTPQDFNKNKTRLKKKSIPSLNLTRPPLSDESLNHFPVPFSQTGNILYLLQKLHVLYVIG